jgi:ABC-type nickel/cobalt efflux system permease component RcnA
VRWSVGIIIAFAVSLVVSALMGPSPASAHMNHMKTDAAHAHPAVSHHQTPDHSQDDAKADGACCMLACVPVIMNERPPAQVRLRVTECVAPLLDRITAMHRGEPPFHPPRRA